MDNKTTFRLFTLRRVAAAAAVLLLFSVGSYFLFRHQAPPPIVQIQQPVKDIAPGGNKAILTLANGKQVVLDSAANGALAQEGNTKITKLDSGRLAYNAVGLSGEVLYNTIATPRGGQYQLVLADGSKIWLNSASSLRFPTAFNGKERIVELAGEGYFEVVHDAKNPFHVRVNGADVEDIGTHFNINAYPDEAGIKTTLLEGSVKVSNGSVSKIIRPGEQAQIENQGNPLIPQIMVQANVDIDKIMAWKNGWFEFDQLDLGGVMRQVSRWYDVDIEYAGKVTAEKFGGRISKSLPLSSVIAMLENSGMGFRLEGKKLVVTRLK